MIKDRKLLEAFERKFQAEDRIDLETKYKILDALYREAVHLGVFPLKDPLEGIEVDIRVAKVINAVRESAEKDR
ncbi:MAG TPA: hypothetical protein DHV12_02720 [Thermotogae bacterium]|nr:hypothetical protein [Thermotogota bacterium]